jgi:uncharacterized protein (TIRG00374 family)
VIRGAAGLGVLVVVLLRVPLRDLGARFASVHATEAALLVGIAVVQMTVGAARWWRLLVRLGERPSFGAVYRDLLVGALFNTLLPTNVGGDVVRALRSSRRLEAGHHAWSTSIFERLVGMLVLAVVGAIATLFALGETLPGRARVIVIGIALALAVAIPFIATPLRLLVRVLERRLSTKLIADVRGVIADLEGPLASAGARIETFAWSLLGFVLGLAYVTVAARALGAPGHFLAIVVGIPIVSVLSLAPISIGGHGVREGLFVVVLGMLGIPRDVALGLALLALANNLFFALIGGAVVLIEPTTQAKPEAK